MRKKKIIKSIIIFFLIMLFIIGIILFSENIKEIPMIENIKKAITEVTKNSNGDLILTSKVNLEQQMEKVV